MLSITAAVKIAGIVSSIFLLGETSFALPSTFLYFSGQIGSWVWKYFISFSKLSFIGPSPTKALSPIKTVGIPWFFISYLWLKSLNSYWFEELKYISYGLIWTFGYFLARSLIKGSTLAQWGQPFP